MRDGLTAPEALGRMMNTNANAPWRQVMLLDSSGLTAQHSGEHTLGINNLAHGKDCAAGGNLLANPDVPARMVAAFEASTGHLGDRLLAVMRAALAAGGEAGPVHSAGMLIVREVSWPVADLRVDWAEEDPIGELETLWTSDRPQLNAYVTRALNPSGSPSYGVPGDE